MSQDQDQNYIKRIINGDAQAFALLVEKYKHMVFTLALRIVKNREEAEEISQDVFVKIYNAITNYKGDAKFSTWLYRITYNKSLDYLKKQKRNLDTFSVDEYENMDFIEMENIIRNIEEKERKEAINKILKELKAKDGVLITLYYYEELSLIEIAQVMNLSPNTVKVQLHRSRKRLAKLLKEKLEPEIIQGYGKK